MPAKPPERASRASPSRVPNRAGRVLRTHPPPDGQGLAVSLEVRLEASFEEFAGAGESALDRFWTDLKDLRNLGLGQLFES